MNLADIQEWNAVFAQVKARFDARNRHGLVCKHGYYKDCCVLKLQKASWTNDPLDRIENQSGIFFSVWSNRDSLRKCRVLYNIHALKLRELDGYTIASRDFASDFRKRFASVREAWPNARVDHGPATLMQGWIGSESDVFGEEILVLMERFGRLSPMIDALLESRRTSRRR